MSRPVKVTPAMVQRMRELRAQGKTNRQIGRELFVSWQTVRQVLNGRYRNEFLPMIKTPSQPPKREVDTSAAATPQNAATPAKTVRAKKLAPVILNTTEAVPVSSSNETQTAKEAAMLLQNHDLHIETQDHFKLDRNPFVDDINSRADVFASAGTRRVRNAMLSAAQHNGFLAVVGESGSGKSTLRKDLEERIRIERLPIRVIKPYTVQMEPTDTKGKTLKSGAIADAIARTLSPGISLKSSPDARFNQVHDLLRASSERGYSNVIVIEEAHRLPLPTLRHLKGFRELDDGMRSLLGVCLIGQPELDRLLGAQNRDIREIVQRCSRVELGPMDEDLQAYLQHKFERAGADVKSVLGADAYAAIHAALVQVARGGQRMNDTRNMCYPLVVNNLLCKAMNLATLEKWPLVTAQVIQQCCRC